jgi:hypothetical protein
MDDSKEGFVFDEKRHLYFYDGKPMTGCTTILGILAKPALIPCAAKMATEYVRTEPKKTDKWKWSDELPRILDEAKGAHARKRDDAADAGTDLHALVESTVKAAIQRHDGVIPSEWMALPELTAINPFIKWAYKENIRFIATETRLYSKELWVAGTVDLVFEKNGKRFVGDIKTYKKLWDRVPLIQCAGHALMWEEMQLARPAAELVDEMKGGVNPLDIDGYCVICLPKERAFNEAEDVMWSFDPQAGREAFISAVKLYRYLNQ